MNPYWLQKIINRIQLALPIIKRYKPCNYTIITWGGSDSFIEVKLYSLKGCWSIETRIGHCMQNRRKRDKKECK